MLQNKIHFTNNSRKMNFRKKNFNALFQNNLNKLPLKLHHLFVLEIARNKTNLYLNMSFKELFYV